MATDAMEEAEAATSRERADRGRSWDKMPPGSVQTHNNYF